MIHESVRSLVSDVVVLNHLTEKKMQGVTITDRDERNALAFDLKDVLAALGPAAAVSRWHIRDVEALGEEAAEKLHKLSDQSAAVGGDQLLKLADSVWQVVDGKFEGFSEGENEPWVIIHAVDSCAYDVQSVSSTVLDNLRERFVAVADLPT